MAIHLRREPTYLSTEVFRACWLIAQSGSSKLDDPSRVVSADEVADTLLRDLLKEDYPEVFEHQKQVKKMETELIKTLGEGK